ncbi:LysR family transcriptional regulator [Pelosinus propionicus]|uniref:DNA-binding transcriptional regulator, LysR family n=1 Tax=Pelosinus propionicus DSM 13327 TaxID=1123291 RepID=A0A1I4MYR3_9FIRM|nr:LysR family transcriptional regulator [Pelosinus propionicus]SFM08225.1 DNA-binding transcriptional regulator, LysR family [Pelosinus propionicus DSM 13327]
MELRQIQIFYTAAQTLNFTKAGAKLGYAQSNITGQIRQLEEELQVKLFERLGRGIQLTNEGQSFLKNAEQILHLCQVAKEEFSSHVFRGTISIGAAETLCVYRLPKILTEYRKLYPFVEIRVQTESCDNLFSLIKANAIDVALVLTDTIKSPDMAIQTLHQETMTIVTSPFHRLAQQQKKMSPHDFSDECLILTSPGCGYRPLILSCLKKHNVKPGSIMEFSSVGAIKECTICGLGAAILPKIAVKDELERKKLVEFAWDGPHFDVKTQLIYHREKWITPALRAFLELCNTIAS